MNINLDPNKKEKLVELIQELIADTMNDITGMNVSRQKLMEEIRGLIDIAESKIRYLESELFLFKRTVNNETIYEDYAIIFVLQNLITELITLL